MRKKPLQRCLVTQKLGQFNLEVKTVTDIKKNKLILQSKNTEGK